jgi:hypothetical protein
MIDRRWRDSSQAVVQRDARLLRDLTMSANPATDRGDHHNRPLSCVNAVRILPTMVHHLKQQ